MKNLKIFKFGRNWEEKKICFFGRKFVSSYNLMQNTFGKVEKNEQNWKRPETFEICFPINFDWKCKTFIYGGEIEY